MANPLDIRFTQPTVSPNFSSGGHTLTSTVSDLKSGALLPSDLPPIRIVEHEGLVWSLDNRRLLSFQNAGIDEIPVIRLSLDDPNVLKEFGRKFNPINEGLNVVIAPASEQKEALKHLLLYGKIQRR